MPKNPRIFFLDWQSNWLKDQQQRILDEQQFFIG